MPLLHYIQIGDLKGLFGLLMVNMQMLRGKLKVLDMSYGNGTGKVVKVLIQSPFILMVKYNYDN